MKSHLALHKILYTYVNHLCLLAGLLRQYAMYCCCNINTQYMVMAAGGGEEHLALPVCKSHLNQIQAWG